MKTLILLCRLLPYVGILVLAAGITFGILELYAFALQRLAA